MEFKIVKVGGKFKTINITKSVIDISQYNNNKGTKPNAFSRIENIIALSFPNNGELFIKNMSQPNQFLTIKPTQNTDQKIGNQIFSIGKLKINSKYLESQLKIIYSTETSSQTFINELHIYSRKSKWNHYNFEKLYIIESTDSIYGKPIQIQSNGHNLVF